VVLHCSAAYLKVPPPIRSPHLTIFTDRPILLLVDFLRCVALFSLECGIPHELINAFDRITVPQFDIFCSELSVLVELISLDAEY
jgi:hypothetical protein